MKETESPILRTHVLDAALARAVIILGAHRALIGSKALGSTEAAC